MSAIIPPTIVENVAARIFSFKSLERPTSFELTATDSSPKSSYKHPGIRGCDGTAQLRHY